MTFEKINKCKKLDETLVCKEAEPVREVRENAPCEVKFTIHQNQTNLADCNIKISQLHDTYWLRLYEVNTWVFSTVSTETIFIQCRRLVYSAFEISDTGIIRLNPGCAAHTNNARITASREFKYKSSNILFAELQLNLKHILKIFSNSSDIMSNLDNIIQGEISTKAKNMHRIHKDTLESGSNLNEIIQKLKALSKHKFIDTEIHTVTERTSIIS